MVDICLLPLPSRTWEYQALQLASSFQTLADDWLTFREKAAKPVTCFTVQRFNRLSRLSVFVFCMTVCQIVTARITRHTQLFVDFFLIFKPPSGSWLPRVIKIIMKKALRETQTPHGRAGCSKVQTPPTRCHKPTDRTDYNRLRRS